MLENSNTQIIIEALYKKNKRRFSKKSLTKQAYHIAPAYRDFIAKVISNNYLKIKFKYDDGFIVSNEDGEILKKLTRKQKNTIYVDISDLDTLPHELGHAADFWFGRINALTKVVIIKDGKTLNDIFTEEFNSKEQELYELVMNEYKNIINSNINDKAYDILINNIDKYRMLLTLDPSFKKERRLIQKELYESGFVETYYQLYDKKCYSILNNKYSPILDALSSKHDFNGLCLHYHDKDYYKMSKSRPVQEFFANLFAAKVTSKHLYVDKLIKYLPQSFEAFERLFVVFYDHIQNNKRFVDLKIRRKSM